jgi:probable F420-dependent oxidoreductase
MGQIRESVAEIESLGYNALWLPESVGGRDVLTFSAVVLAETSRIPVATGIAVIWVRDATVAANASKTIDEAFPGRFVLGLGVSHRKSGAQRGYEYSHPLEAMRRYLEEIESADYEAPARTMPPVLLGALGPRMLELAGQKASGAHPFLSSVAHTARAREILGVGPFLGPELGVIATTDTSVALSTAQEFLRRFLAWPNYRNHLGRLGYSKEVIEGDNVESLIGDLFAWGSESQIRERIDGHLAAGADHVAVQIIPVEGGDWLTEVRRLAPILIG